MENLPSPTLWAIPFFVITVALEWLWSRKSRTIRYETKDALTSLALGSGSVVAGVLTGGLVLALSLWVYEHRIFDLQLGWPNILWIVPLAFVLDDFAYYWFHRTAHRVRWFWASHVIHHSSQHYNLSTALRQTWTGFFSLSFLFSMPLFYLGIPPALVFFLSGLNLVYQYWIHTEAIDRMPRWFESVMNTPSHHRVHHATNPRYLDRNYAGVFIIWDKMFGTFEPETDAEKIQYGIVKNLDSFNLLWAAFHEWIGIAKDFWSAPWRYKINYLIKPPGWSHDGSRESSETIKARWAEQERVTWQNLTSSSSGAVRQGVQSQDD
ncbi:sterol desaturase family protein [Sphingorhabdus sp. 109]|jgi:sterol desaturase/sphingolipid hydroxylase (fatty acid hydroxylase superfamily)|uniref:sterol desaturase family protein n=1 Tax=Sphingorhabdus sp. 109 TaxID=2653173 RepID=UPI0012F148DC|nr:sterol desaturase family protein [Sphingorhabdus sp. 109]VWX58959.1 C-5 sterol desaturase [Sphingorhabdus sp. 109]